MVALPNIFIVLIIVSIGSDVSFGVEPKLVPERLGTIPKDLLNEIRQENLKLQNYFRAIHKADPLVLDDKLNKDAQEYAERLIMENDRAEIYHDKPLLSRLKQGENLGSRWFSNTRDEKTAQSEYVANANKNIIGMYNEFCNFPGYVDDNGHYTQMVWQGSTHLGIGYAVSKDRKSEVLSARYTPAGNVYWRNPGEDTYKLFKTNVAAPYCYELMCPQGKSTRPMARDKYPTLEKCGVPSSAIEKVNNNADAGTGSAGSTFGYTPLTLSTVVVSAWTVYFSQ